jgi:membrane-associated protease RseP (regulator of RpoE activity)
VGSRIAAVLAGIVLCAGMAAGDIQAQEVASREAWVYGIHLGENGAAGHPFVIEVNRKSPAKLAGLKTGDEIIRIQDAPVRDLHDAVRTLNDQPRGRIVKIYADRGAVPVSVEFFCPGRPKSAASAAALTSSATGAGSQPAPPTAATSGSPTPQNGTVNATPPAAKKRRHHRKARSGQSPGAAPAAEPSAAPGQEPTAPAKP